MPSCIDTTWGKRQRPGLTEPGPEAPPDGHRAAWQGRSLTCSAPVSASKATRSRVPPWPRSRTRRVMFLPSSSSQRLRLRCWLPGGGKRLGAGRDFPRAASCGLRRHEGPGFPTAPSSARLAVTRASRKAGSAQVWLRRQSGFRGSHQPRRSG